MCVKKAMRHYNLKKEKTLVTFSNTGFHWKGTKSKDMDVLAMCSNCSKADIIMEVASLTSQKNKNNIKDKTSAK